MEECACGAKNDRSSRAQILANSFLERRAISLVQLVFCLLCRPWLRPIGLQIVKLQCRLRVRWALWPNPPSHVPSRFAQIDCMTTKRAFFARPASTSHSQRERDAMYWKVVHNWYWWYERLVLVKKEWKNSLFFWQKNPPLLPKSRIRRIMKRRHHDFWTPEKVATPRTHLAFCPKQVEWSR